MQGQWLRRRRHDVRSVVALTMRRCVGVVRYLGASGSRWGLAPPACPNLVDPALCLPHVPRHQVLNIEAGMKPTTPRIDIYDHSR